MSPQIGFVCPTCKTLMNVPVDLAGTEVNCFKCGQRLHIPSPEQNKPILAQLLDTEDGIPGETDSSSSSQFASGPPPPPLAQLIADPISLEENRSSRKFPKKYVIVPLVLACIGVMVWATVLLLKPLLGGPGLSDELRYLPDDTRAIVSVDVRTLLTSSASKKVFKSWQDALKTRAAEAVAEIEDIESNVEKATGLALNDFIRVTVAVTVEKNQPEMPIFVVKVDNANRLKIKGKTYDPQTNKLAWKAPEVEDETVGKFTLKKFTREEGSPEQLSFCIVNDRTIVFGPIRVVRAILRRERDAELAPGMKEAMSQLDFSQAIGVAVSHKDLRSRDTIFFDHLLQDNIPPKIRDMLPTDLRDKFQGLSDGLVTESAQLRIGSQFEVQATLTYKEPADAADAVQNLNAFLKDAGRKLAEKEGVPEQILKIVESIRFTARGPSASASFRLGPDKLIQLIEDSARMMEDYEKKNPRRARKLFQLP